MEPARPARVERRLAAILAADVAGYSRLIEADEEGTLGRLRVLRAEIIDPKIAGHRGRIVKTTGDGLLVEFSSVVDALRCAAEAQAAMAETNAALPTDRRIEFRIGINVGDIVVEDGDIFGDGVNIAARLEGLAEPGGICVSARVQEDATGKLDLSFEDMGEQSLKNIARPVRAYRVLAAAGSAATQPSAGPALPDKPSIAVLPFANMSGDPEQEYFADGMVEEIITALSRIRWLFVIARNSSFTYKGKAVDVKQVGRELGVRYVLEGSVRKAGGRVRITGQVIDALTGTHLWADRFDGSLEDIFDLQGKVAVSVVGVIEPALEAAEIRRASARPTTDLSAYDLYLRALALSHALTRDAFEESLRLLDEAIDRVPAYGPALALATMCHVRRHLSGWTDDPEAELQQCVDRARRAMAASQNDGPVIVLAAQGLAYGGDDIAAATTQISRGLQLSPSHAEGWLGSGYLRIWAGEPNRAIEDVHRFQRLSPHDYRETGHRALGMAHFVARDFEEARKYLLLAVQEYPGWPQNYRFLAAACAHLGRRDEAREAIERLRPLVPGIMPAVTHLRRPEHRELFLLGLRLAAGEAM
jgi:TolB-like protein